MTNQTPDFSPLTDEQIAILTDIQKDIYLRLGEKDRQFYAENFSPESLGKALDRKWEIMQSHARKDAFEQKVRADIEANAVAESSDVPLSAKDIGIGAAGVAGAVGMGVLASQIAPEGSAVWRGVRPRDLVNPLVNAFARQENTDIRFDTPTEEGVRQGVILLRTPNGLVPGLTIVLTPLEEATQVQVSELTSEGIMEAIREGGLKLLGLLKDGLISRQRGDVVGMAGRVLDEGMDIARLVKEMDLEDKTWEVIKNAADPLQQIFDERMEIEKEQRLKLEALWDDYYNCPRCGVEFGADDAECRVCGTERPVMPKKVDPRRITK